MKLSKLNNRMLFLAPTVQAGWENQSSRNDFEQIKILGKGSFGLVWQGRHKKTGNVYAIKEIKKKSIQSPKLLQHVKTQVRIMYLLNHPHIIKLYNHFEDDFSIYFVLQFAEKGELYRCMMNDFPQKRLPQQKASEYVKQIVDALIYIHQQNIIHRDIKPENILIDRDGNLKLADFGWSNFVEELHSKRQTYCGTLDYLAPQMVEKSHHHDFRVDIWSVGVLIFELINGFGPFSYELLKSNIMSEEKVKENISKINYKLPATMSEQAKDLVSRILVKQPEKRISFGEILQHKWITKFQQNEDKYEQRQREWLNSIKSQFQTVANNPIVDKAEMFTEEQIYKCARLEGILNKKIDLHNQKQTQSHKRIQQLQLRVKQLELDSKIKDEQIFNLKKTNQNLMNHLSKDSHEECRLRSQRLMTTIREQSEQIKNMHVRILENERKLRQYAQN